MRIYTLETKTFDFDALLDMIPNHPEPIGDGEIEKHPLHTQRFKTIADYLIQKHNADFRSYAADTGTFDKRQLEIAENWDYSKVDPLDITKKEWGLKVRDGRHRCIIIAVLVLTGQIAYQPVDGEITDFQNCVDTPNFCEFFCNWVLRFENKPEYKASLRIYFEAAELEDTDLKKTVDLYGETADKMLKEVGYRDRITPLKIVGVCREVTKNSERIDIMC